MIFLSVSRPSLRSFFKIKKSPISFGKNDIRDDLSMYSSISYNVGASIPIKLHSSLEGPYTPGTFTPAWRISTVIWPRW
jgi:hypothetical protein